MSKNQQKELSIPTPEGFNFHDLNLAKGEDGKSVWDHRLFGKILQDNGLSVDQYSEQEIEIIMGEWYSEHLANGGTNEEYADYQLFFFTEELLAGDENYSVIEPRYKINNDLLLVLPEGFDFIDFNIEQSYEDGRILFNEVLLEETLKNNSLDINNFSRQQQLECLVALYDYYIEHGGKAYWNYDLLLDSPRIAQRFEPKRYVCAIVQPPRALGIKKMREHLGHTLLDTGTMLEVPRSVIKSYESGEELPSPHLYTLWLLLTGQHPTLEITERPEPVNEDAYIDCDKNEQ